MINRGPVPCRPLFTLEGEGPVTVKNGAPALTLPRLNGSAVIDCEEGTARNGSGEELNVAGRFPDLKRGMNLVELSGKVTSARVLPRERRC